MLISTRSDELHHFRLRKIDKLTDKKTNCDGNDPFGECKTRISAQDRDT